MGVFNSEVIFDGGVANGEQFFVFFWDDKVNSVQTEIVYLAKFHYFLHCVFLAADPGNVGIILQHFPVSYSGVLDFLLLPKICLV